MKRSILVLFFIILNIIVVTKVGASSGRLRTDSIKMCNGVSYGQHSSDNHWHVAENHDGIYYAVGSAISNDPCESSYTNAEVSVPENNYNTTEQSSSSNNENTIQNEVVTEQPPTTTQKPKSNDNTLKEIIIDNEKVEVLVNIEYKTKKERVNINVVPNHEKSSFVIKNNDILNIGNNIITIEVTAEDNSIKIYSINVIREKELSSDTGITITIKNEKVIFKNNEAKVYISSSDNNLIIDYKLSNENANVNLPEINNLKEGNNYYELLVTAEDGTKEKYKIIIYKPSKLSDSIATIFAYAILIGIGYGIYKLIKKMLIKR